VHLMRVAHHKLVRDQIPAIITADGGQPVTRVLDDAGYEAALRAKLLPLLVRLGITPEVIADHLTAAPGCQRQELAGYDDRYRLRASRRKAGAGPS
jgi:hypothetical protein